MGYGATESVLLATKISLNQSLRSSWPSNTGKEERWLWVRDYCKDPRHWGDNFNPSGTILRNVLQCTRLWLLCDDSGRCVTILTVVWRLWAFYSASGCCVTILSLVSRLLFVTTLCFVTLLCCLTTLCFVTLLCCVTTLCFVTVLCCVTIR